MATEATGIMLTAGAISFGNEWLQSGNPNFRIPVATLASTFFLHGLTKIYPKAATGLSVIVLITVLITPLNGKSPMQTVIEVLPKPKG
jgi:hypothetical protein